MSDTITDAEYTEAAEAFRAVSAAEPGARFCALRRYIHNGPDCPADRVATLVVVGASILTEQVRGWGFTPGPHGYVYLVPSLQTNPDMLAAEQLLVAMLNDDMPMTEALIMAHFEVAGVRGLGRVIGSLATMYRGGAR